MEDWGSNKQEKLDAGLPESTNVHYGLHFSLFNTNMNVLILILIIKKKKNVTNQVFSLMTSKFKIS